MVTCAKLGLRVKYIGTVGMTSAAESSSKACARTGINPDDAEIRQELPNRDRLHSHRPSHRRTNRTLAAQRLPAARSATAMTVEEDHLLRGSFHIDAHDTATAGARRPDRAASIRIPVTVDVDTIYHGLATAFCHYVDYSGGELRVSQCSGPTSAIRFWALETIQEEFQTSPVAAMTLGALGALARVDGRFIYSPAFVVNCADTTGAPGTCFMARSVMLCWAEHADARNALSFQTLRRLRNCTALGARGGISTIDQARVLIRTRRAPVASRFRSRTRF